MVIQNMKVDNLRSMLFYFEVGAVPQVTRSTGHPDASRTLKQRI
jgi:hypothetical protein